MKLNNNIKYYYAMWRFTLTIIFVIFISCKKPKNKVNDNYVHELKQKKDVIYTNGFDFPVGKPNAKGYYNAQKFTENNHLGEDWNGVKGGNSDLGDAIYAVANGYVIFAEDVKGGWGNVIRVVHYINKTKKVESLYAHCDQILIKKNQFVKKGQKIATIGTAHGIYIAHLHLEIRDAINMPIGGGYHVNTTGYLNPTKFIKQNRN